MIGFPIRWRLLPAQIGVVLTFALFPLWLRLPQIGVFTPLYVTRFAVFVAMIATIGAWIMGGAPGLASLRRGDGVGGKWRRAWAICLLALAAWAAFSTQWAFIRYRDPTVAGSAALGLCVVALFAVVVACTASPRMVIAALACGVVWSAPIVIVQAMQQSWLGLRLLGEFPFHADMTGISILRAGDLLYVRPYGLMPHPNAAAGALMVGVLAAAALLFAHGSRLRLLGVGLVTLGVTALLLTFSRAAWIGAAAGGAAGMWLLGRLAWRRRDLRWGIVLCVVLVGIVGVIWLAAYRPFVAARALGESASDGGQESVELRSVADRIVFTDFALRSIRERPILGVGMGNFPWRASYYIADTFYDLRGDNVHHIYLSAWAELGGVGLILFVGALIGGIGAAWRAIRADKAAAAGGSAVQSDEGRTAAQIAYRVGLVAAVIAFAAVGWFDHYPWTLLPFQMGLWGCVAAGASIAGTASDHGRSYSSNSTPPVLRG